MLQALPLLILVMFYLTKNRNKSHDTILQNIMLSLINKIVVYILHIIIIQKNKKNIVSNLQNFVDELIYEIAFNINSCKNISFKKVFYAPIFCWFCLKKKETDLTNQKKYANQKNETQKNINQLKNNTKTMKY